MRVFLAIAAVAVGLMGACGGARAQFSTPFTLMDPGPQVRPADPRITVGPYRARVYGYYRAYDDRGVRVRGYRRCEGHDWHFWWDERCRSWR